MTDGEGIGRYNVTVSGGRGVYVGDHGIQVNLFTGKPSPGPVVAGNVPQAPPAFRPREDLLAALRSAGPGVPLARALLGDQHPETLFARCQLASCHYLAGRPAEAIARSERAIPGLERQLGSSHPSTVAARSSLATVLITARRAGGAAG